MKARRPRPTALAIAGFALVACGSPVDLGSGTDASTEDAAVVVPTSSDGGPVLHCGSLDAPSVPSTCHACESDAGDCQPNGCYGGYWCNYPKSDCAAPPKVCP